MIGDYFRFAFKSIKHKGTRSLLTMTGIFIGVAAIVSLISLGEGMQAAMNEQFELLGSNFVMVVPGGGFFGMGGGTTLGERDVKLTRQVRGVDIAGGTISKIGKVEFKNEIKYTWITGLPTDETQDIYLEGTGIEIIEGQKKFKPSDRYKAAITYLIAEGEFFDKPVEIGDKITIEGKKFDVVGRLSRIGNSQDDSALWIPYDTAKDIFDIKEDEYQALIVRTKDGFSPADVAEDIRKKLRRDRGQKKGEEDFMVMTTDQIKESVGEVLDTVNAILLGIAAISLIVGGVGIMNTMYTSVLERTQEIGVMKAIGARNSDILSIFLIESGILGMVGGLVGIIIGAGLSKAVELMVNESLGSTLIKAQVTPGLILGTLAFSFIVGTISGVLPARQASQLKPVDALRYE